MTEPAIEKKPTVINDVNVSQLGETVEAIQQDPDIAKFEFRARNRWLGGGHNRSTIQSFYGACEEDSTRTAPFVLDADEPPVLLGTDRGANPVEYLLHALAACVTTSTVYHAAAQGIEIEAVESSLEGDLDLQGFLGLKEDVRRGFQKIRINFKVKGDASEEQLRALSQMSPVLDIVTNPVPVEIHIEQESPSR